LLHNVMRATGDDHAADPWHGTPASYDRRDLARPRKDYV
jgi:hypothetical protein